MNIFRQHQSIVVLASFIGSSAITAYIPIGNFLKQQAIAIVPRHQSLTVDRSLPSLPGKLALDEIQKENILKINQVFNQKIQEILTLEQLQQFTAAIANGLGLLPALNTLSLTREQKKELQFALKSAQRQVEQILTPEQLDYVRQQQENQYQDRPTKDLKIQQEKEIYYVILNSSSRTTV